MSQIKFYGEVYNEEYPENKSVVYIGQESRWDDKSKKVIMLPHSCDEWIIGGEKEARELIKDLEKLILELSNGSNHDSDKKAFNS